MRDLTHPSTIKTSAPSLEGVIERRRLIDALAQLHASAKWLQSPSGTGKSTLAASYARSRKKPLVWYRLDERDNDAAFFYADFAQAFRNQLRPKAQLAKFSGDDHDRQHVFAQNFATALSDQLAKPTLIVMDDVQTVVNPAMQQTLGGGTVVDHHSEGPRVAVRFPIDATCSIFRFNCHATACLTKRRRSAFRSRRM